MSLSCQTFAAIHGPLTSSPPSVSVKANTHGRRSLFSFIILSTATAVTDSRTKLFEDYLKRSKENKEKNDRERQDDYYRRNYKDYFEFIEGSSQGKEDESLSESEKGIREWLKKNQK